MLKEKIAALLHAAKDDQDIFELVKEALEACTDYTKFVADMEIHMQIARFRMDAEEYQGYVMELDTSRRRRHENVISNLKILNRLFETFNMSGLDFGSGDREAYAAIAKEVTDAYYVCAC